MVNAAAAGSALTVPACTYRESVTISRALTLRGPGATISGRNTAGTIVRQTWLVVNASDVTVEGFTFRDASNPPQTGAIRTAAGISRFTLRDGDLSGAGGAAVSIGVANASLLENNAIHDNGSLGVHLGGDGVNGRGNVVRANRIYRNNAARANDPLWEAGGLKATQQTGLQLVANEVYENVGPGLWSDIYCHGTTYARNRVHDNTHAGIMEEVSFDGVITDNVVYRNGAGDTRGWGWPAGILVTSSTGTTVSGNTLAWNGTGISVIGQARTDWPDVKPYRAITVTGNTVVEHGTAKLLGWFDPDGQGLFGTSNANRGSTNRYWSGASDPSGCRFEWNGCLSTLASFNATPGEEGATYLSTTERDQLLAAAGAPTAP